MALWLLHSFCGEAEWGVHRSKTQSWHLHSLNLQPLLKQIMDFSLSLSLFLLSLRHRWTVRDTMHFNFKICQKLPQHSHIHAKGMHSERSEPVFRGALEINEDWLIGSPDCIWFGIGMLNTQPCWLAGGPRSLDPNLLCWVGPEGCLSCLTERIKDNIKS